jgi:integrase
LSLDISQLPGGFSLKLAADFSLNEAEIQKGQAAAIGFLDSLEGDERTSAKEALELLTLVFSTGVCEGVDFPWHQVRAHHGQAAMNMLKQDGAPSRLESLRCQLDPHHKFRHDSDKYTTKRIHRFRTTLKRVLKESRNLGFMSNDDWTRVNTPHKDLPARAGDRIVSHGEFRALVAACHVEDNHEAIRDRLVFYLLYHGGLMLAELLAANLEDLHFDQKTQRVTVKTGKAKNQKSRRVALPNEALISLEDWLEKRGNEPGALLYPVTKGRSEAKRMSGGDVRTLCENRARAASVLLFTPDELRKSPATQIGLAKADARRAKQQQERKLAAAPQPLFDAETPERPYEVDEVMGSRAMATVCFPVWEVSIKS